MIVVVVKGLIVKDRKVLLLQRNPPAYEWGKWDFPGGKIEDGEDLKEALVREIREETGLICEVRKPLEVKSSYLPERQKHYIIIIYECSYVNGNVTLNEEHSNWQWVDQKDIKDCDVVNYLRDI